MSIASQISRITQNVSDALDAIEAKGVTIPSGSNSDDLAELIEQIPQGSGEAIKIVDTLDPAGGTVRTITAITVSGTKTIMQNGTGIDVAEFSAVDVNVPTGGVENAYEVMLTQNAQGLWKPSETYAELVSIWNDVPLVFTINNSGYYVNKASHNNNKFYYSVAEEGSAGENEWTVVTTYYSYDANGVSQESQYTYTDASDGTATPTDVASGKIFYTSTGREVGTGSSGGTYQAKEHITPTESSQTITADQNYDALSSVQIDPISSTYVGSGITRRSSTDLTASGATVTVPSGYYQSQGSKAVASGSATAPASISGTSATVSTGTNTLTLTKTVSVTPSVTAGYVSSGTAGNSSVSLQASVTTKAAATIHPSTSDQTIASGTYTTGAQTIKGVLLTNLSADNIKSGVTVTVGDSTDADCVTSVTGTYSGGSSKAIYKYEGLASRQANSYGATNAKVTVTKAGTYNISFVAIRGSSSGTMGTNLYIGSTAKGNNTTWNNGTYGQYVSYTSQSIAANTAVTIYATSGSNSRYIYVGQLIVEEV